MTCQHLWLPRQRTLWRTVWCGHCGEARRVRRRWATPEPATIAAALAEAIDHHVIGSDEVLWGGRRLR